LIEEINAYDGFVTTSSCSGRVSVFLEGAGASVGDEANGDDGRDRPGRRTARATTPGVDGCGGRWLYISHEQVRLDCPGDCSLMEKFHLIPPDASGHVRVLDWKDRESTRLIRFAFEPMILHVTAASLRHARPLLSAAVSSGFRESGVQGLRNLDEPGACPTVAVRTAGLALESVVGHVARGETCRALVSEDYLAVLVELANERFVANRERVERFRACLRQNMAAAETQGDETTREGWKDSDKRRQRKCKQGMQEKSANKRTVQDVSRIRLLRESVSTTEDDRVENIQSLFDD